MLGDCSERISKEHPIPASILREIEKFGTLGTSGLPWQKGEVQQLPVGSLASKVLCERHNQALSSLDAEFHRLFRALICRDDDEFSTTVDDETIVLFNGRDIERSLLKLAVGRAAGKIAVSQDGLVSATPTFDSLVPALFGRKMFARDRLGRRADRFSRGFHLCDGVGENGSHQPGVSAVSLAVRGTVFGEYFDCKGLRMAFLLRPIPWDVASFLRKPVHRPRSTEICRGEGRPVVICFGWERKTSDIEIV